MCFLRRAVLAHSDSWNKVRKAVRQRCIHRQLIQRGFINPVITTATSNQLPFPRSGSTVTQLLIQPWYSKWDERREDKYKNQKIVTLLFTCCTRAQGEGRDDPVAEEITLTQLCSHSAFWQLKSLRARHQTVQRVELYSRKRLLHRPLSVTGEA